MFAKNAFIVVLLLLHGCGPTPVPELTIATDATFPPFHYVAANGEVSGFDVELGRELAVRSGFAPKVIVLAYDRLFDDLLSGDFHVVAATTGITPERKEKFLFSAAYFDTCQAALVRVGRGEPENLADLAGRRAGAAGAGTSVKALHELSDVIPVLLSEREATDDTIQEDGSVPLLENGDIDALIVDEMDAVAAARKSNGRLRVLPQPVAAEQYGFVFAPDAVELKQAFDEALASMRDDGSLDDLQRRFGLHRSEDWPIRKIP